MMVDDEIAPEGTYDHAPAPPCPECRGERYWSDYWTDEFIAICVPCTARRTCEQDKETNDGEG